MVENGLLTPDVSDEVSESLRKTAYSVEDINNALQVEETTTLLNLEPDDISPGRDLKVEKNNGTVSFNPSFGSNDTYGCETNSGDTDSEASLETAKEIDYRSGHKFEIGIRALAQQIEGGFAEWGIGGDGRSNEAFFRQDKDDIVYGVINKNGTETEVSQSEWSNTNIRDVKNENGNVDFQVVGFDPFRSGSTLNKSDFPSFGYVYKISYTWYGQGIIVFKVVAINEDGRQQPIPCMGLIPKSQTSFNNPNQPLFARVKNNGTSSNNKLNIAGRQAAFAGNNISKVNPIRHLIESPPTISSSSYTTVLIARRKSGFEGTPIGIIGVNIIGSSSYDVEIRGRVDTSSNPSYSDPNRSLDGVPTVEIDESTSINSDTGFITAGEPVDTGNSGSGPDTTSKARVESRLPTFVRQKPMALMMKDLTGSDSTPTAISVAFDSGL